jgi:hypothetical protein
MNRTLQVRTREYKYSNSMEHSGRTCSSRMQGLWNSSFRGFMMSETTKDIDSRY